ncbi:caspase-8-like isoform X1 [Dendropsophus ebraccatus]|uniref:caspase-8-like isoform X1 n=1 Tax=Dendropsophus ebraccatus TaxID=150705 RepID=UPI0038317E6C
MDNFISLLYNINNGLDSSNFSELKFLCKDLVPYKYLNGIQDTSLFIILQQMGYINKDNTSLIKELLFYLKRFDLLLKHFHLPKRTIVENMKNPALAQISPYRRLLYELGNLIPDNKLAEIVLNCTKVLPNVTLENVASLWDLFIELEKRYIISEDNLNFLKKMAQYSEDESFMEHILTYEKKKAAAAPGSMNIDNDINKNQTCRTDEVDAEPIATVNTSISQFSSSTYKMNNNPRGICLIISNFDFSKARNAGQQDLTDRRGTEKDEESLFKVFSELGFKVRKEKDLEGNEIVQTTKSYREQNHEQNDCFVCCVLSHGNRGLIYGTDGQSVPIKDLTSCFCSSQCSTLTGKPKLFFIQACQGKDKQKLVSLPTDAHRASDGSKFSDDLIPDEPDFLLGMATTLQYVSYRDPVHGTWYIQSLCKQLHASYQSQEDIISTLTKVNLELSKKQANHHETQMPQPWTTLTRKLVFTKL